MRLAFNLLAAALVVSMMIAAARAETLTRADECAAIRVYVDLVGREEAEKIAVARGATEDQLRQARACLARAHRHAPGREAQRAE